MENLDLKLFRLFSASLLLVVLSGPFSIAQKDSLLNILKTKMADSTKIKILFELIDLEDDNKIWPAYNKDASKIIEKHLKNAKGKERQKYLAYKASYILNVGYLFNQRGDMVNGLKKYKEALVLYESVKDSSGIGIALNNVGFVLQNMAEFESALNYYKRGYEIKKAAGDSAGMGVGLSNIASVYEFLKRPLLASKYYIQAVKLHERTKNIRLKAIAISNLATNMMDLNKFDTAFLLVQQSLKLREELKNPDDLALSNLILAQYYTRLRETDKAYKSALKAYELSKIYNISETVKRCAESLYKICAQRGDKSKAFDYFKEFISLRDTIFNIYSHRETVRMQLNYEYEKEQLADSIRVSQEKKVMALQLQQEKNQRLILYIGLSLVIVFALIIFNRFRTTRKQKEIIEIQKAIVDEKQKEVMDSIHYSKRIQQALLPGQKYIHNSLKRLKKS